MGSWLFLTSALFSLQQLAYATHSNWSLVHVGLMILDPPLSQSTLLDSHLVRRSIASQRRDYAQSVASFSRRDGGLDMLYRTRGNGTEMVERGLDSFESVITWYTGADLLDPSCLPSGGWQPTDDSMIAAVTLNWLGKPPCGSFLELRPRLLPSLGSPISSSIIVRVMDACAGCTPGVPHVDLTKAAFEQLYNLDIGVVEGIEVRVLDGPPFARYGRNEIALYGPKSLD